MQPRRRGPVVPGSVRRGTGAAGIFQDELVRWTPILTKWGDSTLTLPMSIEKPNADITVPDAFGTYSKRPDFTIGLRWNAPDGHLQWANLFRDLAVETLALSAGHWTDSIPEIGQFRTGGRDLVPSFRKCRIPSGMDENAIQISDD